MLVFFALARVPEATAASYRILVMPDTAKPQNEVAPELFARVEQGDAAAKDELFAHCYAELKRLARGRLVHTSHSATLDTTSLVHDVYLKLANMGGIATTSRGHFMAYAARTMRSLIIDIIRSRGAEMHGGNATHLSLDTDLSERLAADEASVLGIHETLDQLAEVDLRLVQVVEMRYFAGFTDDEIAKSLGVNVRTVSRDWQRARVLLAAALRS